VDEMLGLVHMESCK